MHPQKENPTRPLPAAEVCVQLRKKVVQPRNDAGQRDEERGHHEAHKTELLARFRLRRLGRVNGDRQAQLRLFGCLALELGAEVGGDALRKGGRKKWGGQVWVNASACTLSSGQKRRACAVEHKAEEQDAVLATRTGEGLNRRRGNACFDVAKQALVNAHWCGMSSVSKG